MGYCEASEEEAEDPSHDDHCRSCYDPIFKLFIVVKQQQQYYPKYHHPYTKYYSKNDDYAKGSHSPSNYQKGRTSS